MLPRTLDTSLMVIPLKSCGILEINDWWKNTFAHLQWRQPRTKAERFLDKKIEQIQEIGEALKIVCWESMRANVTDVKLCKPLAFEENLSSLDHPAERRLRKMCNSFLLSHFYHFLYILIIIVACLTLQTLSVRVRTVVRTMCSRWVKNLTASKKRGNCIVLWRWIKRILDSVSKG